MGPGPQLMVLSAAWVSPVCTEEPETWTAHLRDLGLSALAPKPARQSPGRQQGPSRSRDGSWNQPSDRGNTSQVPRPKRSIGECCPLETVDPIFRSSLPRSPNPPSRRLSRSSEAPGKRLFNDLVG